MKILKRKDKNKNWNRISQQAYKDEAELQDLIYEDPSIIPIDEVSEEQEEIKVAIKEYGLPGAGSSDIIGIDRDGNITIIETKLAVNSEIKRKVIGQILEYASFFWKKTYEQFNRTIEEKTDRPLLDQMSDLIEDEDWSEENFRRNVSSNLRQGNFSLFIVVDDIDDNLKRILEFINSSSFSGPQIYAFAARYYQDNENKEVLVPQVYGASVKETEKKKESSTERKTWDKESFLKQTKKKAGEESKKITKLYNYFKDEADKISWGTGAVNGSFSPIFNNLSESTAPFTFYSDGRVLIKFNWILEYASEENKKENTNKVAEEFIETLKKKTNIKIKEDYLNETLRIDGDKFFENFDIFFKAIKKTIAKIK